MAGRIVTVHGDVPADQLGVTLTHEHLSMSFEVSYVPPPVKELSDLDFNLGNSGWIRQNPYSHSDNLVLNDKEAEEAVLSSVQEFKRSGGGCLVENSTMGLHRRSTYLKELSSKTGVHVVAGTGYYVVASQEKDKLSFTAEEMAAFMTSELTQGCFDDQTVKCGLIGEIGCTWPLHDFEKRAIRACAAVQEVEKCAVSFHPGRNPEAPFEIMRIFLEAGGKADKTIMSHLERTILKHETLLEFAKLGAYCQFDLFGIENSYYQVATHIDFPSDAQRMDYIEHLILEGHEDRVLIAQDIHSKHRLETFGGHGYSHILKNVVPKMLKHKKITQENVTKILVNNPAIVLAYP